MALSSFTRSEALARGITVRQLAGPGYQRLFHDAYVMGGAAIEPADRARAALRFAPPGSHVSHQTAAAIWGSWVPAGSETHISVPDDGVRSRRQGVQAHRARGGAPVKRSGLLVSTPTQTFLELAAGRMELVDLVVVGDGLVRAGVVTPDDLVLATDHDSGSGVRLARRAARLVRAGVDSAPESRLRLLIVLAGFPEPEVNHVLRALDGAGGRRFDLSYPALKLIVEYDGRHHAESAEQWSSDLRRREELERQGWTLIVVNAAALFNDPVETLERIRVALEDRGCDLPPRIKPAWNRHFGR